MIEDVCSGEDLDTGCRELSKEILFSRRGPRLRDIENKMESRSSFQSPSSLENLYSTGYSLDSLSFTTDMDGNVDQVSGRECIDKTKSQEYRQVNGIQIKAKHKIYRVIEVDPGFEPGLPEYLLLRQEHSCIHYGWAS